MENDTHIITPEELQDLATGLAGLPESDLEHVWYEIQCSKYNGLLLEGDTAQPNLIFGAVELPLIKRIYPPEMVQPLVKKWISFLYKRAKTTEKMKMSQYLDMRRYGIPIDSARKKLQPMYSSGFLLKVAKEYERPFQYKYDLSCRDADVLYRIGLEQFVKLFYDRFYQPVIK